MKTRLFTVLIALFTIVLSAQASVNYEIDKAGWCVKVYSYTSKIDAVKAIWDFDKLEHTGVVTNDLRGDVQLPCVILKGADLEDAQLLVSNLTDAGAEAEVVLPINEKNFGSSDDTMFLHFLADNYDSDGDGFITYSEIYAIGGLNISGHRMSVVPGLGYFARLRTIDCTNCYGINTLDVSNNSRIHRIKCSRNNITNDWGPNYGVQKLVDNLPQAANGAIEFYDNSQGDEKNEITMDQVSTVHYKGWRVMRYNEKHENWVEFFGTSIEIFPCYFPDDVFRNYVANEIDTDGDGLLSINEIDAVTTMNLSGKSIQDLTGIDYFTYLETLDVSSNSLTSLDLSHNYNLETLNVSGNSLTSLDVSDNYYLKSLDCSNNKLSQLDIYENRNLEQLNCSRNKLTALKIFANNSLKVLSTFFNQIKGRAMYEMVQKLKSGNCEEFIPVAKNGTFEGGSYVEGNVMTKQIVAIASAREWQPQIFTSQGLTAYVGSDPNRVMSYTMNDCEVSLASATEAEMELYYGILNGLFILGDLMAANNIAPYYNKNSKLLFTLSSVNENTVQVTVAPGITVSDNIVHVLTDDERITLYNRGYSNIDYFDVKKIGLKFGTGVATGITTTEADNNKHMRYNLSGQRVGTGYRGIVIENGHKWFVK